MAYIIKTQCIEVKSSIDNNVITEDGKWIWVCEGEYGCETTGVSPYLYKDPPKYI